MSSITSGQFFGTGLDDAEHKLKMKDKRFVIVFVAAYDGNVATREI